MRILFESEDFLAVDKEPGWLSVPSRWGDKEERLCVGTRLAEERGRENIFPLHRLDFDVSGLLLFAKNAAAHRQANLWFEQRQVKKQYEAWSEGPRPPQKRYEWKSVLLRGKKRAYESPHGKPSLTSAEWVETGPDACQIWRLEPQTGRSHQLRFEMAKHGWPILGDVLYGSTRDWPQGGIALRARSLDFSECPGRERFRALPDRLEVPGLSDTGL